LDGEYNSASDFDDDTLALIATRDGAKSDSDKAMEVMGAETADQLIKVEHDQCHNLFQTRGVVKDRDVWIIIDGGIVTIWPALTWWRSLLYPHDNDLIHITFNGLRALISSR
jgi:hypothetical protein